MASITLQVTPRVQFSVPGSGQKTNVTIPQLNDLGNPIVSGTIADTDVIPYLEITVGSKVGSSIEVTLQVKLGGSAVSNIYKIPVFLSDSNTTAAVSATSPSTTPTGFTANQATLFTNSSGAYSLTITHSGTHSWYLWAETNGKVAISGVITF